MGSGYHMGGCCEGHEGHESYHGGQHECHHGFEGGWGGHHGEGCGCREYGGHHHEPGVCGCGHGEHKMLFQRHFHTREERMAKLEAYLHELETEAQAVREILEKMRSKGVPQTD